MIQTETARSTCQRHSDPPPPPPLMVMLPLTAKINKTTIRWEINLRERPRFITVYNIYILWPLWYVLDTKQWLTNTCNLRLRYYVQIITYYFYIFILDLFKSFFSFSLSFLSLSLSIFFSLLWLTSNNDIILLNIAAAYMR